ncbi:MAG: glycyl-radical enzyme activating protein [Desulfobacteraceae bacterium]|jgi:pyruvate formate lyase activating enzyme
MVQQTIESLSSKLSKPSKGLVLEIQRMSTEDGPGIRSTVFLKGCPLRCAWCHNPESISARPQVHWVESRCIGCRSCIPACPEMALSDEAGNIQINREKCLGCGSCAEACPAMAMELLGRPWSSEDLIREVLKDRVFFETSKGGVTLSGGEPTLQKTFAAKFLMGLQSASVHTALDTCGLCDNGALRALLPFSNLVLFDLKIMDSLKHKELTGSPNEQILENLKHVAEYVRSNGHKTALWIRTPVIPGATDTMENIRAIGSFLASACHGQVARWELCAFNNLCRNKYDRLGRTWMYNDAPLLTAEAMEFLAETARQSGVDPDIVSWSGVTRMPGT